MEERLNELRNRLKVRKGRRGFGDNVREIEAGIERLEALLND